MREELLGYLLGALEPEEEREVEDRLNSQPELRRELSELRRLVRPLAQDDTWIDPPTGLAGRVCDTIHEQRLTEVVAELPYVRPWGSLDGIAVFSLAALLPW